MARLGFVALAVLAGAAQADTCLTAADLAPGITVKTASGAVYHYTAHGADVLATVPWQKARNGHASELVFQKGVYVVQERMTHAKDTSGAKDVVGGLSGALEVSDVTFPRTAPLPASGTSWTGTVKTQDITLSEGIPQTPVTDQFQATYQFLPEIAASFGACRYRIIPAEVSWIITPQSVMRFDGVERAPLAADLGGLRDKRRMLFFADLGFAVITKIEPNVRSTYSFTNGVTGLQRTVG